VDQRFKELGDKISRGGWFLYVVGIGGLTDAKIIADAVPGSVYQSTDSSLEGLDVGGQEKEADASAQAEAARLAEEARKAEEARIAEEEWNRGIMGFFRRLAASLGISLTALFIILAVILLVIILAIILLARIFRTIEIIITDEKETLIRKLAPFAGILLNSAAGNLPALGVDNSQILRIQRSAFSLNVNIMDEAAVADSSPYKKRGSHPLKGVISLANGRLIRVTVRG
jgi:hypothetical protein